jgi:hypothetical protein
MAEATVKVEAGGREEEAQAADARAQGCWVADWAVVVRVAVADSG